MKISLKDPHGLEMVSFLRQILEMVLVVSGVFLVVLEIVLVLLGVLQ